MADDLYPQDCAFCKISAAYPAAASSSPIPSSPDPELCQPQCHLLLSTPHVLAFLDIMPIAPGHILLTTRKHYEKLSNLQRPQPSKPTTWTSLRASQDALDASRAIGEWLPILSRALCEVTGVEDWNIVQNNGVRAAQVVGHVHFHLIPRYQEGREERKKNGMGEAQMRSWRMFGKGVREDLDEEEGRELSGKLRAALRVELGEGAEERGKKEKGRL